MVERKEVEVLLAACEAGEPGWYGTTDPPTVAALCRAWLALEGAPKVRVRGKVGEVCMVPVSHDFCGQRVRIVKEAWET